MTRPAHSRKSHLKKKITSPHVHLAPSEEKKIHAVNSANSLNMENFAAPLYQEPPLMMEALSPTDPGLAIHLIENQISLKNQLPTNTLRSSFHAQASQNPSPWLHCSMWIGVAKPQGALNPRELLSLTSEEEVFKKATDEGLEVEEPVLLAQCTEAEPRFFYLASNFDFNSEIAELNPKQNKIAVQTLVDTIESLQPKSIGVYLAPELFEDIESAKLALANILKAFIKKNIVKNIYLLVGSYGTSHILNTALKVKEELFEQGAPQVTVFH